MKKVDFPERLRRTRETRGFSQAELERRAGFAPGHLCRLESGTRAGDRVTMDVAVKLADSLDVEVLWLFTGRLPRSGWKPPV